MCLVSLCHVTAGQQILSLLYQTEQSQLRTKIALFSKNVLHLNRQTCLRNSQQFACLLLHTSYLHI